jgi:hypothetical protein
MRGSHGGGGNSRATNTISKGSKIRPRSEDGLSINVFRENPWGFDFFNDSPHFGPQVFCNTPSV